MRSNLIGPLLACAIAAIASIPLTLADECGFGLPCMVSVPVSGATQTFYIELRPTDQAAAMYEESNGIAGVQRGGCAIESAMCEAPHWIDHDVAGGQIQPDTLLFILPGTTCAGPACT